MNREQKKAFVDRVASMIQEAGVVVVARYIGLNAAQMTQLRDRMHESGAKFKVVKNRLAWRALDRLDVSPAGSKEMFSGPTAIACSEDPVLAPRLLMRFSQDHEALEVIGGMLRERFLDAAEVKRIAKLPSLDELRGKIVGQLNAPATRIATILEQPATGLVRLFALRGQQPQI